ncbi:HAD family hydrolase [Lentzea albidocapillata]|uniref:HAD family hydrolase n=1 Tax=Lentzea albidocapillata TaxID=40571 RepID=UPI001FE24611|nr:HAD family hydrolase [Lentzea albidocapillata]
MKISPDSSHRDRPWLRRVRDQHPNVDRGGPVCSVFAGLPAPTVADQLREILAEGGHLNLPLDIQNSEDPFDVFKDAASVGPDEARYVESALRALDVEAASTARPTPGAGDLIRAWSESGRKIAIVSNNSNECIETYLHIHNLQGFIPEVSGRTFDDPDLLKSNPFIVDRAISNLKGTPKACILAGDSVSDIEAAKLAGTQSIGYANRPHKQNKLDDADADAVVSNMAARRKKLF